VIGLLQRVSQATVRVNGDVVGAIDHGLLLFMCAQPADTQAQAEKLLAKVLKLRIFNDETGKMNRSLQDVQGGLLIVSQFTLAADASRGNRPGFSAAAAPELGRQLYDRLVAMARAQHPQVACGRFGADMKVSLVNDGPVTIPLCVS
jgi:D-aminoacyl-tRNA deacylase